MANDECDQKGGQTWLQLGMRTKELISKTTIFKFGIVSSRSMTLRSPSDCLPPKEKERIKSKATLVERLTTHCVLQVRNTRRISTDCLARSPLSRRTPMARNPSSSRARATAQKFGIPLLQTGSKHTETASAAHPLL